MQAVVGVFKTGRESFGARTYISSEQIRDRFNSFIELLAARSSNTIHSTVTYQLQSALNTRKMYPLVLVLVATLLQSVLGYHLGHQHLHSISRRVLTVSVSDVETDLEFDSDISVDCTATGGLDTPYLSFFWLLSDDTSLPLSSNMPGVYIETFVKPNQKPVANRKQQRPLANNSETMITTLVLNRRFYEILRQGPNTFACHAYTFKGQQALQYFTVNKV